MKIFKELSTSFMYHKGVYIVLFIGIFYVIQLSTLIIGIV